MFLNSNKFYDNLIQNCAYIFNNIQTLLNNHTMINHCTVIKILFEKEYILYFKHKKYNFFCILNDFK